MYLLCYFVIYIRPNSGVRVIGNLAQKLKPRNFVLVQINAFFDAAQSCVYQDNLFERRGHYTTILSTASAVNDFRGMATEIVSDGAPSTPTSAAVWQADEAVSHCPLCETKFSWYYRKHHCRKCGRVVCSRCCSNFIGLRHNDIVHPPEDVAASLISLIPSMLAEDSMNGTMEVRTCDGCFSRLEQDRCRRMLGLDIATLDPRVAAQLIRDSSTVPSVLASPPPSYSRSSGILVTTRSAAVDSPSVPVGDRRNSTGYINTARGRDHRIRRTRRGTHDHPGESSSHPQQHFRPVFPSRPPPEDVVPLRYVSFELTDNDKMLGEECPICFEEYEQGQCIARLECWCVFHLGCIRAWKDQKAGTGGCPLHFHD